MSKKTQVAWLVSVALVGIAACWPDTVRADHVAGHDDDDEVFPVPIPGHKHFNGGIVFITAIGPVGGSEIFNTSFDITYVSDGVTPASDIVISVGMLVGGENPGYVETHVTGADLGFDDGPGAHSGIFETDDLNGIAVESFLLPPYSSVNIAIGAVDGGIEGSGHFVNSTINFELVDFPSGDVNGDGVTDLLDLLQLLAAWGECAGCPEDIDGDGVVGPLDLQLLLDDLMPGPFSFSGAN